MDKTFLLLLDTLKTLPNVSTKQAKNIIYYIVKQDDYYLEKLTKQLKEIKENFHHCKTCNSLIEGDTCEICDSTMRNRKKLCICCNDIEKDKIEETKNYMGMYFVMGDELNRKNNTFKRDVVEKLIKLLNANSFEEIIVATNWTNNGNLSAINIKKIIDEAEINCKLYRLAIGIPMNAQINYADSETLTFSIKNKVEFN